MGSRLLVRRGRFSPAPGLGASLRLPGDGLAGYYGWLRRSELVLTIRLARIGKKKKPFYRVVVIERTRPRNGRVKELVGTYDPLKKPAEIKLDADRIKYWLRGGAAERHGAEFYQTTEDCLEVWKLEVKNLEVE